jgi:hypothetical protein
MGVRCDMHECCVGNLATYPEVNNLFDDPGVKWTLGSKGEMVVCWIYLTLIATRDGFL